MRNLYELKNKTSVKKTLNAILKNSAIIGPDAVDLISELRKETEVYLIGGFIRNVLHGENIRDIDMILNAPIKQNQRILKLFPDNFKLNRLGGAKLKLSKVSVDLWSVNENWANKKNLIATEHIQINEIAKGTFFNFDSIVYSLNSNVLNCYYYNKCVTSRTLDIIKHVRKYIYTNPNRAANIIRALYLNEKYRLKFSSFLEEYIQIQMRSISFEHIDVLAYFSSVLKAYPKYGDYLSNEKLIDRIDRYIKKDKGKGDYPAIPIGLFD
jgi:hypothetical protein